MTDRLCRCVSIMSTEKYCTECGGARSQFCVFCKTVLPLSVKYCGNCGFATPTKKEVGCIVSRGVNGIMNLPIEHGIAETKLPEMSTIVYEEQTHTITILDYDALQLILQCLNGTSEVGRMLVNHLLKAKFPCGKFFMCIEAGKTRNDLHLDTNVVDAKSVLARNLLRSVWYRS